MTRTALVTGASSGIGAAFALALARRGYNVVLVARRADRLEAVAETIAMTLGRKAHVLVADLAVPEAPDRMVRALAERGITVDLLVNNAGVAYYEAFSEMPREQAMAMVQLNVTALTAMSHAFLPGMAERGRGAVVNIASTAALQPIPYGAVYAASKSYVLSFSEALAEELAPQGVQVLCVCPGSTESEIHGTSGVDPAVVRLAPMMSAEAVAEESLRALDAGKRVIVPGPMNEAHAWLTRMLPRDVAARLAGTIFKPNRLR